MKAMELLKMSKEEKKNSNLGNDVAIGAGAAGAATHAGFHKVLDSDEFTRKGYRQVKKVNNEVFGKKMPKSETKQLFRKSKRIVKGTNGALGAAALLLAGSGIAGRYENSKKDKK